MLNLIDETSNTAQGAEAGEKAMRLAFNKVLIVRSKIKLF